MRRGPASPLRSSAAGSWRSGCWRTASAPPRLITLARRSHSTALPCSSARMRWSCPRCARAVRGCMDDQPPFKWCRLPASLLPPAHPAFRLPCIPQVALLFLVKGPFHHETLWRLWFQSAAGLLPADVVAASLCSAGGSSTAQQRVMRACGSAVAAHPASAAQAADGSGRKARALLEGGAAAAPTNGAPAAAAAGPGSAFRSSGASSDGGILDQQVLFDVYVHPHPSFPGGPPGLPLGRNLLTQRGRAWLLLPPLVPRACGSRTLPAACEPRTPTCLAGCAGYPPGSLFRGRELPAEDRVATQWGQHSLVDAGGRCSSWRCCPALLGAPCFPGGAAPAPPCQPCRRSCPEPPPVFPPLALALQPVRCCAPRTATHGSPSLRCCRRATCRCTARSCCIRRCGPGSAAAAAAAAAAVLDDAGCCWRCLALVQGA